MTLGAATLEALLMILDEVIILEVPVVVLIGKEAGAGAEAGALVVAIVIVAGAQGLFRFSCKIKTQNVRGNQNDMMFCFVVYLQGSITLVAHGQFLNNPDQSLFQGLLNPFLPMTTSFPKDIV